MKRSIQIQAVSLVAVLVLAIAASDASVILIGPGVRNGNFNDDTSADDTRTFEETPFWENIGSGDQTSEATRTTISFDGTRSHVLAETTTRIAAQSTTHTLSVDDLIEISYFWRDAYQWNDSNDQVSIRLFTTDDNLISGTATTFATLLSGTSTSNNTYESVSDSATAGAAEAGKMLFVAIDSLNSDNGFARVDNFQLQVTPAPEPTTMSVLALGGLVMLRRRKRA